MSGESTGLVRYDAMCHAIAEAREIDEAKDIRDKAMALQVYMRQAGNTEAEDRCYEIRRRAEHKAGELRAAMEKAKGGRPAETPSKAAVVLQKTNAELGLTDRQSADWQKLAAVPQEQFDAAFANGGKPSIADITAAARSPVSDDALLLIGTLRDFERRGYLARSPAEFMTSMTETMLEEVYRIAPLAAAWLSTAAPKTALGEQDRARVKSWAERFGAEAGCAMQVHNFVAAFLEEAPPAEWGAIFIAVRGSLTDLELWAKAEIEAAENRPRGLDFDGGDP
jgi:hypothetical protein